MLYIADHITNTKVHTPKSDLGKESLQREVKIIVKKSCFEEVICLFDIAMCCLLGESIDYAGGFVIAK